MASTSSRFVKIGAAAAVATLIAASALITNSSLVAQDPAPAPATEPAPKKGVDSPLVPPPFIDYADVTPPLQSFQYWLDTVTTGDEEFTDIVIRARGLAADTKLSAAEIREERIRRLNASFDFEAMLDAAEQGNPARGEMTIDERRNARDAMVKLFLGTVTREKYAARNIRATRLAKVDGAENPNWQAGTAVIEVDMFDTVERATVRYRVHMKLFPRGLIWRWYKSEGLGTVAEVTSPAKPDSGVNADTAKALAGLDSEITRLSELVEAEDAKVREAEDRLALLRERLAARQAEKQELERVQDPYGTPELALRTAHKAMRDGNWERFLASHSSIVRDKAGPAAKSRFLHSSKRDEVKSIAILETIADPTDVGKIRLKVRLTISFREQQKYDSEEKEAYVEAREERRVVTISFVREEGKWLINDDL